MNAHETRFKKRVGMVAQNSFGTVAQEDDVEMTFIIKVGEAKEDGSQYGSLRRGRALVRGRGACGYGWHVLPV